LNSLKDLVLQLSHIVLELGESAAGFEVVGRTEKNVESVFEVLFSKLQKYS